VHETFEHLFTPLALGPALLPNRIVSTAHQTTLVHDHLPTGEFVAYHGARARGGAGLIVLEATAVHPSGMLTPHTLGGYLPEIVDRYRRVADAVQPDRTRLFVQLFHGGREQIGTAPRSPAVAPSPVPSQRFRVEPRALTATEIDEIVDGYGRAAELAATGGLDGVEISAAHRYLIEQFLDPTLNLRNDEWRDGRALLTAVLRAVRQGAPSLCVGVRLSADSQRVVGLLELLQTEGVDYVSLALGDSSTGGGPAGIAAALEAGRAGHDVVVLERTARLGGQIALAGAAPGGASLAAVFLDNARRQLAEAGVEVRLDTRATAALVLELAPAAVIVATGARPHRNDPTSAWDVLAGRLPDGETVLVVDWGGDLSGVDAAEVLAAAGRTVTLAVTSVAAAEGVHQYRRNLYLQRLYRAGVTILHHFELVSVAGTAASLRNVFAPEIVQTIHVDAVVLALGRVPEDSPAAELRQHGLAVEEAGDCLSPRSLEEAVLEGTLAARVLIGSARP
jgi:2,4-dienoyl-CoA reductase-like NADH-dependent reductase (Old Yellow Enzyme family)